MKYLKFSFISLLSIFVMLISFFSGCSSGKINVLVTAPRQYADRFISACAETNINPISIPLIETTLSNDSVIQQLITQIEQYDFIAFSSRKAIEAFDKSLQSKGIDKEDFSHVIFLGIGKDNEYLKAIIGDYAKVLEPVEASPQGIVRTLDDFKDIDNKRIAILVPEVVGMEEPFVIPNFISQLNSIGLDVDRYNVYRTAPSLKSLNRLYNIIDEGEINCVAFSSGGEVSVFMDYLDRKIPSNLKIACFGPYTMKTAIDNGLKVDIVSKDFSSYQGYIDAIINYFKVQK